MRITGDCINNQFDDKQVSIFYELFTKSYYMIKCIYESVTRSQSILSANSSLVHVNCSQITRHISQTRLTVRETKPWYFEALRASPRVPTDINRPYVARTCIVCIVNRPEMFVKSPYVRRSNFYISFG